MKRLEITLFFLLLLCSYALAEDIYEEYLNRGLTNNEPYSYSLSKAASVRPENAKQLLKEALRHSPDTPSFYFELSKASLPEMDSLSHAIEGIKTYKRNFWWQLSLACLLYFSLIISLAIAIGAVLLIRLPMAIPLIKHDIEEDWKKLLLPLLLILLSVLGPLMFAAGALFLIGLYLKKMNKAAVYLTLLLILASPLLLRQANILLGASSPKLRAIVSLNEGRENKYAIHALAEEEDFASRFSYALGLKREGRIEEAKAVYQDILTKTNDPRVYTNMGDAYVALGEMEPAKESYKKSIELKQSVHSLYNLSQVLRNTMEFSQGDEYFSQASVLDRDMVSWFTSIRSIKPNRFVIDETLSTKEIWGLARDNYKETIQLSKINPLIVALLSGLLIVLFPVAGRAIKQKAQRCARCGAIFCSSCAKGSRSTDMCPKCYASLVKPSLQPPKERVAQLLTIHGRKDKSRKIIKALSFTIPGLAHIYSGRILSGLIYLWLFLFSVSVIFLNPILKTGLSGYSHAWVNLPAALSAGIFYLIPAISIRRRL